MFYFLVMSADDSLNEVELDPADGDLYEVGEDGGDDGDGTQQSWSSLTVAALKSALVERGLQTTGRKAELVARLEASKSGRLSVQFLM